MMKAVMRELAQAQRHYSKLPLFEFLRNESIPARDRLAFYPCMAPYVLAFPDLCRCVLRDESTDDPYQKLINERTYESGSHAAWYLEDFTRLGFDRSANVTQALRSYLRDDARENRLLALRLTQLLHRANSIQKLVAMECLEQTGKTLFEITAKIAGQIEAAGMPALRYLGQFQRGGANSHPGRARDHGVLESIALTSLERVRCLDLSFRVFDLFADWSAELLAYAKNSLAQRTVPHFIHSKPGADDRASQRLA